MTHLQFHARKALKTNVHLALNFSYSPESKEHKGKLKEKFETKGNLFSLGEQDESYKKERHIK